jgi:regulation of enolase protein 1 (concanavalin A-like superfamily)
MLSQISLTALGLPAGQHAADIGSPAITGSTSYASGAYLIHAGGADVRGTSDQFHFVYQQASGDLDVRLRVNTMTLSAPGAKAGVMIRETLTAGSNHAYAVLSAAQGFAFHRRPAANGTTVSTSGSLRLAPGWVRLRRSGTLFTAYESIDGQTWTPIASDSIPMADTVYVGIAVTSQNPAIATDVVADALTITETGLPNQPPTVSITSPASNATFTAPASITINANATDPENQLVRVEFYNGTALLGTDTAAPYSFTWSSVPAGTYSLTARAYDAGGLNTTSAAVSVTVNAVNQFPPGQQAADIGSPAITGSTSYASGTYQIHAGGVDIGGTSDQFHFVYQQASGDLDVRLRVDSMTLSASGAKAGVMIRETLTAGSHHGAAVVSANQGFAFHRRPIANGATVSTSGSTGGAPGWVRLTRSGSVFTAYESVDGQTWSPIASDSITMANTVYVGIAVTSQNPTTATDVVAAALTLTETASENQPPTVSLSSPASNATFTAPATITMTANATDPENQLASVEFFNGTTLLGTDTTAPYSFTWSSVPAGTYSLTAKAHDTCGLHTTSAAVTITVTAAGGEPPTAVVFQASTDHEIVTSYQVDVFAQGANPDTATPIATTDIGRPAPNASNEISAAIPSFFAALAPGTYQLTVAARNGEEFSRSLPVTFVR